MSGHRTPNDLPSFEDLPQRVFLDSSTLQAMHGYGGFLYENGSLSAADPIHRDPRGASKLEALRSIMQVAERAPFEFALSEHSLVEVGAAGDRRYLQWAYDVLDYWLAFEAPELNIPAAQSVFCAPSFGYLSSGDRALLEDALALNCQAFLTMENRLPKNAMHIQARTGLRVLSPIEMWELLRPWARLFR